MSSFGQTLALSADFRVTCARALVDEVRDLFDSQPVSQHQLAVLPGAAWRRGRLGVRIGRGERAAGGGCVGAGVLESGVQGVSGELRAKAALFRGHFLFGRGWSLPSLRRLLELSVRADVRTSPAGAGELSNERLRAALLERGLTPTKLASSVGVDPKTVERWVGGRTPYRRHRYDIASYLELDEAYLWPDALSPEQVSAAAESEILAVYPHRWSVPRDAWERIFTKAETEIGVLVYSGLFLAEDTQLRKLLEEKACDGVRVRIMLGDPDSPHVAQRGSDEGIEDAMAGKIRNVLVLYRSLRESGGVEIRMHSTTLYNSIYRGDDQMLVNTHVHGAPAANAPVLHLRRVAGGDMVTTYLDSYELVWSEATPLD